VGRAPSGNAIQLPDGTTPTARDLGLNVAGSVLQVVDGRTTTYTTHGTTSYTDTNLSVTITPKSANSKLYFMVCGCYWFATDDHSTAEYAVARIVDSRTGATIMPQGGSYETLWFQGAFPDRNSYDRMITGFTSIDTDNTDTRTYKVQGKIFYGSWSVRYFEHTADNIIRVMEIAG